MVLVEGENADGATVDTENFELPAGRTPDAPDAPRQVVSAILGTREGAVEAGYELASIGVTWTEAGQAATLNDLLAGLKIEKVMLVSAFLAAAALAQTVGNATHYAQTALLFLEPYTATLAVVDSADGSLADARRQNLPDDEHAAVAALTAMVAGVDGLQPRPDGLFVVGSDGVDVAAIKPQLQRATSLVVSTPAEPETALAMGAALASANPPLFSSSTAAMAYAQDPGTGAVAPAAVPGYLEIPAAVEEGDEALAYSAVPDEEADALTAATGGFFASAAIGGEEDGERLETTRPFLVAIGVLSLFVGGVVALVFALAIAIRPHVDNRPAIGATAVAPAKPAPPPTPPAKPATQQRPPVKPAPAAPAPAAPPPPAPPPAPPAPPAPPRLPLPAPPVPLRPPGPPIPGPGPGIPGIPGGPPIPGPGPGGPPGIPIPHLPVPGIPGIPGL
uniref:hypothetical protein n=1 Tax=Mycobacterium sp. HUMS_1102779 TaxID=3383487 RepID=UPI003899FF6A